MISDIMTEEPVVCTPETSLEEVAKMMVELDCGAIPVVEDRESRRPIGIVTDRDIVCRVIAQGQNPLEMIADDCMTEGDLATIGPDADIEEAVRMFESRRVRRLLVVDDEERLVGIVAQADLAISTGASGEVVEAVSQPDV